MEGWNGFSLPEYSGDVIYPVHTTSVYKVKVEYGVLSVNSLTSGEEYKRIYLSEAGVAAGESNDIFVESCQSSARFALLSTSEQKKCFCAIRKSCDWTINAFYRIGKRLGASSNAYVHLAKQFSTGKTVQIRIQKNSTDIIELENQRAEALFATNLQHPSILSAVGILYTRMHLYIIYDFVQHGSLKEALQDHGPLSEKDACVVTVNLLRGISYLHSKDVVHCDLKLENVLCGSKEGPFSIKIDGFRHASYNKMSGQVTPRVLVGTSLYMSPEAVRREVLCHKTDVWACGVLLHVMLGNAFPFGRDPVRVFQRILKGSVAFDGKHWINVSQAAREFINLLLQKNRALRPRADELLCHPWIVRHVRARISYKKESSSSQCTLL